MNTIVVATEDQKNIVVELTQTINAQRLALANIKDRVTSNALDIEAGYEPTSGFSEAASRYAEYTGRATAFRTLARGFLDRDSYIVAVTKHISDINVTVGA